MANSDSRKRKRRPITSCLECYRRKQKCDRELPCAICVIRGIPEKCTFGVQSDDAFLLPPKSSTTLPPINGTAELNVGEDVLVDSANFDEQTGYSSSNSNNFSILQKTLRSEDDAVPANGQRTQRRLPGFVTYQISEVTSSFPPRALQDKLIDIYFEQSWWWFSSLEVTSFRQKLERWHCQRNLADETIDERSIRDSHYFAASLFQVFAIALQYLPPNAIDIRSELSLKHRDSADLLSIRYSKAGMQIMDLLGRHNSTTTAVQHDMLRGIWLKNFSRGTESWYSLGNAVRQAQELGLHQRQDPPAALRGAQLNTWLWEDVLNQRIWACLFSWDAHVAFTLGRPRIINSTDCTRMDVNTCDIPCDMSLERPSMTTDNSKPTLVSAIVFHYGMAYLIHEMLDAGAVKPNLEIYDIVDRLHNEINGLLDTLPPYLKFNDPVTCFNLHMPSIPIARLHMMSLAQTYLVALHRPHVLRRSKSCEAAVTAALCTLDAQSQLFYAAPRHKWRIYTYSFYTIDASIFLAALLLERPKTLRTDWYERVTSALVRSLDQLDQMKNVSPMAKTGMQILQRCHDRIKALCLTPNPLNNYTHRESDNDVLSANTTSNGVVEQASSPSFRSWIEQMDQVMLPILEADPNGPFDNALWEVLLEG